MATEYKGLTIKFGADTKAMNSALREAKSVARGTTTELKLLNKGLKLDPSNVTLLAQKQEALTKKIQATKNELQAYKTLEADANSGKAQLNSTQWAKLQSDIVLAKQRLGEYESQLLQIQATQASANTAIGKAGTALSTMGKNAESACAKMGAIGSTLTHTVTAGLAIAGTASVVAATKLDTSLTNVKKTVDGTAEDYQKLKDSAIEFSKTNAVSASQILDVESLGAQLGYTLDIMSNGKSQVQEFGEVVSGLDIATNMDAETAGSELAQFFNIMQLGKEETKNYASAIVDLGNKNATTESSISAMALRIAGAGKQIGMSGADVLGLATALSSLGIEAEMGGTAISTIMSNIDKAVALNNDNLKTWADTAGMSTEEFANAWKNNAADALNQVLTGMQGAVDEGGNMSVMLDELGISSLRQTDVMKRLAGGGETLSKAISTANTAWEQNIALDNEVENRNNSLAAKFEMLKNRVIAVAEQIGRPLADSMLDALNAAQPLFTAIENGAKTFSEMSTEEQQTILGFAGFVAALGPVLSVMSKTSTAFKTVGNMLTTLSTGMAKLNIQALQQANTWTSYGPNLTKATTAMKAHTVATKAGTVATRAFSMALKATVVGAAVAGLSALVSVISEYNEKQSKAKERSEQLQNAQEKLGKSFDVVAEKSSEQASSVGTVTRSYDELRNSVDETIKSVSDLAMSQSETWGELNSKSADVNSIVSEIEELGKKSTLTADEQSKLVQKVEEYNSITGESVSVVDAVTGKLSVSTDQLKQNTQAWELNAKAQALQEQYKDIYKEKLQAEQDYNNALQDEQNFRKQLQEMQDTEGVVGQADLDRMKEYEQTTQDAKTTLDTLNGSLQTTSQKQVEVKNQTFLASEKFKQLSNQLGMTTDDLSKLCDQYGIAGESATTRFVEGLQTGADAVTVASSITAGLSLDEFKKNIADYGVVGSEAISSFATSISEGAEPAVAANAYVAGISWQEFQNKCGQYGITGSEDMSTFATAISNGQGDVIASSANVAGMSISQFQAKCAEYGIEGSNDIQQFAQSIRDNGGDAEHAANEVANNAKNNMNADTYSKGTDFISGFIEGIKSKARDLWNAVTDTVNHAINAVTQAQNSHSPSKVTRSLGQDFGEGYALGIEDMKTDAVKASKDLAKTTANTLSSSMSTKAVKTAMQSYVNMPNAVIKANNTSGELTTWLSNNLGSIINQNAPQTVIDNDAGALIVDNRLVQLQRKAGMNRG